MSETKTGLKSIDGEELIELNGFMINGEVLLSDSYSIGEYEKVKVKVTPSLINFWLEENGDELDINN